MVLGIVFEKKFEGLNMFYKVKMVVFVCLWNCVEFGIKDFGVVGIDGGWEFYVGGNGGIYLCVGDLLMKVKINEEVLEYVGVYL